MAKLRLIGETPLTGEKAKLHHQVDPDEQISDTHALDSLPIPLESPEPREKRNRTTDPQSDTLEAVEVKWARKNSSEPPDPDSELDSDSKVWLGIGYDPSGEEPNWIQQKYERSYQQHLLSEKAYNESYNEDNMPANEPNPLLNQASDRDAAETVSSDQARHSTINPYRIFSPPPSENVT